MKQASAKEKETAATEHSESFSDDQGNLVYDNADVEPELHARTWIALGAFFLLNFVQIMALQGPPAVLAFIGKSLNSPQTQTWIPNGLSLVQAVLGPVIASASDTFQARKTILVATCCVSIIGCGIAPGSQTIGRLIAAQVLIGFGFAAVPLAYAVPSEIVSKKWYPMVQGGMNVVASCSAIASPLSIGALVRRDPENGWRKYYWIQLAVWCATVIGILVGYRPPKRHTRLDHLSLGQKIGRLDLIGFFLLTAGLTLFLTGMGLGESNPWSSSRVLGTMVTGIVVLVAFGLYEWKGTDCGILHHELFIGGKEQGRTFALCVGLIFIEGVLLFAYVIFYPQLTGDLFETDAFLIVARSQPFWVCCGITTAMYGFVSSKFRLIRSPLFVGFLLFTASAIGMATIQPGDSINALCFSGLAGLGFGSPLVLLVSTTQLAVPHRIIATATAVLTSARAIAATVFTASYAAAVSDKAGRLVPEYVTKAAIDAGLPASSVPSFIAGLSAHNQTILANIPGVSPSIITAGSAALQQAQADSIRVVFIIAAAFGTVACVACWFLGDLSKKMNYRVDAPVEDLHAKRITTRSAE